MVNTFEGLLTVKEEKFCIIISRFNEFIGSKLLSGAIDELKRHGVDEANIDVVWSIDKIITLFFMAMGAFIGSFEECV